MSATYHHNYAAFDSAVLAAPFMVAEMRKRAEQGLAFAEAHAPFDAKDSDGDHYRDHFSADAGVREAPTRRAYGRVSNDSDVALFVEFGTKNNKRHRTLGACLDAMKG